MCNSLGIKIDPTIVNMSISGAKIDQGGTETGGSTVATGEVFTGNAGTFIVG